MFAIPLHQLAPFAAAAAVLFTASWIVLGRISVGFTIFGTHVAPYNAIAQSISGLGLGKTAFAMNGAFVVTAMLLTIGILGILAACTALSPTDRLVIGALLFLCPVGVAACGVFNLEHFLPHLVGFVLAMGAPAFGFFALGWRLLHDPSHALMARFLMLAGPVTLALLIAYFWSFDPDASGRGLGYSGLLQRLLATAVLGVFAILGCAGWQ
jgi:hypothetical membrane protein